MRIIHVSAFPVSLKSQNCHAVAKKLSNGFTRNGHDVLDLSDRDMARAAGFGHRRFGVGSANRTLLGLCRLHAPALLLLGHADVILPETLAEIRHALPDVRIVQWNVDPLFESDNVGRIESKLGVVDATLISTAGEALRPFVRPGKQVGFLPNPVDFSIETGRNHEIDELPFDLFYACGNPARPLRFLFGKYWNMNEFIETLAANCPAVRMSLPGMFGQPKLFGHAYQAALEQAGAGLNVSRRGDYFLYSSDRLAHLAGNGLAVCMERGSGYETLFSEEEMVFVSSIEELAARLIELKNSPRRRREIAGAGRKRYHHLFNEVVIARYIEDVAFERLSAGAYEWPALLQSSDT
jgi:hypothetical protein